MGCAKKVALKKMMWWIFPAFLFVSMTLIQPNPLTEAKRPIPADGDQCLEEGDSCLWNGNTRECCEGLMCESIRVSRAVRRHMCTPAATVEVIDDQDEVETTEIPADGDQCLEEGDSCLWNGNTRECCEGLMCELNKTVRRQVCTGSE